MRRTHSHAGPGGGGGPSGIMRACSNGHAFDREFESRVSAAFLTVSVNSNRQRRPQRQGVGPSARPKSDPRTHLQIMHAAGPPSPTPGRHHRRHAPMCVACARGPPTQSPFRPTHAQRCWSSLSTGLAFAPLPLALASVAQGELPNLNPPPRAHPRSLLSDPARTWPRGPAGKHRSRGTNVTLPVLLPWWGLLSSPG